MKLRSDEDIDLRLRDCYRGRLGLVPYADPLCRTRFGATYINVHRLGLCSYMARCPGDPSADARRRQPGQFDPLDDRFAGAW